jgi:predicted transcriptional regulator
MKKARLSVYLDSDMMAQLTDLAERKRQSKSLIAEAAITSFLTPDETDRREAAVTRRLDLLTRQGERVERDLWIAAETLALFLRFGSPSPHRSRKPHKPPPRRKGASASNRSWRRSDAGSRRGRASCARCRLTDCTTGSPSHSRRQQTLNRAPTRTRDEAKNHRATFRTSRRAAGSRVRAARHEQSGNRGVRS